MNEMLLLAVRSVSLAIMVTGFGMFTIAAAKYGLIKTKPYIASVVAGALALVLRAAAQVDSFIDLPASWFLLAIPIWFAIYGFTYIMSAIRICNVQVEQETVFKEALKLKLEQEFKSI